MVGAMALAVALGGFAPGTAPVAPRVAVAEAPASAPLPPVPVGYWLAAADGAVYGVGNAPADGSAAGLRLHGPVVAMAATPDGGGYWLVAADGGVFAFGDARFLGSMGGRWLRDRVVAMAATPDGGGYWLVAADGGVFAFGHAPFLGSVVLARRAAPVVAVAATPDGEGYWLAGAGGVVTAFGDAPVVGSLAPGTATALITGLAVHVVVRPQVSDAATELALYHALWLSTADLVIDTPARLSALDPTESFFGPTAAVIEAGTLGVDDAPSGVTPGQAIVLAGWSSSGRCWWYLQVPAMLSGAGAHGVTAVGSYWAQALMATGACTASAAPDGSGAWASTVPPDLPPLDSAVVTAGLETDFNIVNGLTEAASQYQNNNQTYQDIGPILTQSAPEFAWVGASTVPPLPNGISAETISVGETDDVQGIVLAGLSTTGQCVWGMNLSANPAPGVPGVYGNFGDVTTGGTFYAESDGAVAVCDAASAPTDWRSRLVVDPTAWPITTQASWMPYG